MVIRAQYVVLAAVDHGAFHDWHGAAQLVQAVLATVVHGISRIFGFGGPPPIIADTSLGRGYSALPQQPQERPLAWTGPWTDICRNPSVMCAARVGHAWHRCRPGACCDRACFF